MNESNFLSFGGNMHCYLCGYKGPLPHDCQVLKEETVSSPPVSYGWICPQCKIGCAPWASSCPNCVTRTPIQWTAINL